MVSENTKEKYSKFMCHIKTRLIFALLGATLMAVRGYRGKKTPMSVEKRMKTRLISILFQRRLYTRHTKPWVVKRDGLLLCKFYYVYVLLL